MGLLHDTFDKSLLFSKSPYHVIVQMLSICETSEPIRIDML